MQFRGFYRYYSFFSMFTQYDDVRQRQHNRQNRRCPWAYGRILFCLALGGLISAIVPSPTRAADPAWIGNRHYRILLEVKPSNIGSRARDERSAEVFLDFEQLLSTGVIPERADLSTLQLMRYDPATSQPIPYKNNLYAETPYDLPLQWYDAAIPDPFPDRDWGIVVPWVRHPQDPKPEIEATSPWHARPRWGYYYEVNGDWRKGRLAWTHIQIGNEPSYYAVYFDLLKPGEVPSEPAPRGWIGDGAHRTAKVGTRSTGLLHGHCKMADMDRDGLDDIICGSSRGGLVWCRNFGTRQSPRFTVAKLLFQSDGKAIDPGFYSYPAVTDWDRDGKLDLLIGTNGGYVIFYRNAGSDAAPLYEDKGPLQTDGAVLKTPFAPVPEVQGPRGEPIYKEDYAPSPEVVDWDADGKPDLLLGGYVTGRVFWYQNTGLAKDGLPKLAARGPLMAGDKPVDVGWCASPTVADIDGDRDLDIIVGNWRKWGNEWPPEIVEDFLAYFENVGTRTHPVLTMKPLPRIGTFPNDIPDPINSPTLADWDGDGVLDLVVSRFDFGQLYFFKNVGSAKQPKFDTRTPKALPLPWANDPLPLYAQNMHTYVDWNHDGWPDIISGKSFFSTGAQQIYINTGEGLPWRFKPPVPLLPAGEAIDHRAWRGDDWAWQTLVDFDRDGKTDILVGDFWGQVWFHKNTSSGADTTYDTKGALVTRPDGRPIRVGPGADSPWDFTTLQGSRIHVLAADFDEDGSVDLVLSDTNGYWYYCNRGKYGKQPMVESQVLIKKLASRGNMTAADWDGDNKLDLLISLGTKYYWLRNIGVAGSATPFAQVQTMDLPLVPVLGTEVAIAVMDMNGDGDQDVILASGHNYHCFFERSFLQHGYAHGSVLRVGRRK
jgi:hypothetical protein